MYALFAWVGNQWNLVKFEEHEDCAVNFIAWADEQFGDGTAYVCKMPNRDLDPLTAMLNNFGEVNLDAELKKLNQQFGH